MYMKAAHHPLGDDFGAEGYLTVEAAEPPMVSGERFVQWSEATVTSNALDWTTKNNQTRYNLDQFWKIKNTDYQTNPAGWDALDLRAHQAWASLADIGLAMDNPPAQPKYAAEAQQAYAEAAQIAARIAPPMIQTFQNRAGQSTRWNQEMRTKGVDDSYKAAIVAAAKNAIGTDFLGIPLWAWAIGAVTLLVLVKR